MTQKDHWEKVYSTRRTETLGWYQPHLRISLNWINDINLALEAPIVDIGGGASTLAEDLLNAGYHSITVLDISEKALSFAKGHLGDKAALVTWLEGDVTSVHLPTSYYELWHDRAVFHFLTVHEHRRQYRDNLMKALKPRGHLIISTFAPEAPPKCSGLPVQRYTPKQLEDTLGDQFELRRHHKELHITPGGVEQMYLYCYFRRTA
jgi:2-polyprenyl-3-methyl-5-hydroxy-6-metoxy-1,4-benzoquinol methylase